MRTGRILALNEDHCVAFFEKLIDFNSLSKTMFHRSLAADATFLARASPAATRADSVCITPEALPDRYTSLLAFGARITRKHGADRYFQA
jgi:hypothetical protein